MLNTKIHYYEVVCKCGHVGRRHYVPVPFAIKAENGREAAKIARDYPRVKHQHKDAILSVNELTPDEYQELAKSNEKDLYLKCHSRKEQDISCNLTDRLVDDPSYADRNEIRKENRGKRKAVAGFHLRRQEERESVDRLEISYARLTEWQPEAWETL